MYNIIFLYFLVNIFLVSCSYSFNNFNKDSSFIKAFIDTKYMIPFDTISTIYVNVDTIYQGSQTDITSIIKFKDYEIKYRIEFETNQTNNEINSYNYSNTSICINDSLLSLESISFFPIEIFRTGVEKNPIYYCETEKTSYLISGGSSFKWSGWAGEKIFFLIIDLKNYKVELTNYYTYDFINKYGFLAYDTNSDGYIEIWNLTMDDDTVSGDELIHYYHYFLYDLWDNSYIEDCSFKLRTVLNNSKFKYYFLEVKTYCME